jgi:hypothetical protein
MRGSTVAVLATALIVFASSMAILPSARAQAPSDTLDGTVCAYPQNYYFAPPGAGSMKCDSTYGLPSASVRITHPGPLGNDIGGTDKTVTTDASGHYHFDTLADGTYNLSVSRTGFDTKQMDAPVKGAATQDVALSGQSVKQAGRVADSAGRGIGDAQVSACCGGYGSSQVRTASDGSFTLAVTAGYVNVYVSDAPGFQDLGSLVLMDGSAPVALTLQRVPPQDATLHGVVTDEQGRAVAGIRVYVNSYQYEGPYAVAKPSSSSPTTDSSPMPYYGGGTNHTTSGADGRYSIHVYGGNSVYVTVNEDKFAPYQQSVSVAKGATVTQDIQLLRYPPKTAHLHGQIVDSGSGAGLGTVSISVRSPQYGLYECSSNGQTSGGTDTVTVQPANSGTATTTSMSPGTSVYRPTGCAIQVEADGHFAGDVTPGYTIIEVYFQRQCSQTQNADGSYAQSCGADYYSWSATMNLPADQTTELNVGLAARPSPDAILSGYAVDGGSGQAIAGATFTFGNQRDYSYGSATTDKDGSYRVKLQAGYQTITVCAKDYLPWQSVFDAPTGETPYDVKLTPSKGSTGGCYGGPYPVGIATGRAGDVTYSGTASPGAPANLGTSSGTSGAATTAQGFEDLKGGLGPYNAQERQQALANSNPTTRSPLPGLMLGLAALAIAGAMLRRRVPR